MATIPSSRARKYVHLEKGARCSFRTCNGRKRHARIEWLFKRVQQCGSARTKFIVALSPLHNASPFDSCQQSKAVGCGPNIHENA